MLSYIFLPSQKTTLLLIPYHFTIPPTSKNSIFIKIFLFNLSLLFLSILGFPFSWAFQPFFFFFSQAPSTFSTNHKHKHKPSNPRRISLPPSTTSLSLNLSLNCIFFPQSPSTSSTNHKHKPTSYQSPSLPQPYFFSSATHTNTNHQTHAIKPTKPPIRNSRR